MIRHGVLTGIRMQARPLRINGQAVELPLELILDNEEMDPIPFARVLNLDCKRAAVLENEPEEDEPEEDEDQEEDDEPEEEARSRAPIRRVRRS